jgi:esterase/lipase superfamily enzyme
MGSHTTTQRLLSLWPLILLFGSGYAVAQPIQLGPNTTQYQGDIKYHLLLTGHLKIDPSRATQEELCEASASFQPLIDRTACKLSPDDLIKLRNQAQEIRERFGFRIIKDSFKGADKDLLLRDMWVDLPSNLLPKEPSERTWGNSWLSSSITVELIRHRPGKYTVRSLFNTIMTEDACRYWLHPVDTIAVNAEELSAELSLARTLAQPQTAQKCVSLQQIAEGQRRKVNLDTDSLAPLLKAHLSLYNTDQGVIGIIITYPATAGDLGDDIYAPLARAISYSFYAENVLRFVSVRGCSSSAGGDRISVVFATNREAKFGLTNSDFPIAHLDGAFGSTLSKEMTIGEALIAVPNDTEARRKLSRMAGMPAQEAGLSNHYFVARACLADPPTAQFFDRLQIAGSDKMGFKREDRALLFVHGYDTRFSDALFRLADFVREFDYPGRVFMFSWPSAGSAASYVADMDRAEASEIHLETFLRAILKETSIKQLDVVAHSMGAQPTVRAMRSVLGIFDDISRNWVKASKEARGFGHVVFAAPDADPDVFRAKLRAVIPYAQSVTIYASKIDLAMLASKLLRLGARRVGDINSDGAPFLISGANVIDVSKASEDTFKLNHSYFSENLVILRDLKLLLGREKLSDAITIPHLRLPDAMKRIPEGAEKPDYWRLEPEKKK